MRALTDALSITQREANYEGTVYRGRLRRLGPRNHPRGSSSPRIFRQDAQAVVKASAARSSPSARLPTLTMTIRKQSSQAAA